MLSAHFDYVLGRSKVIHRVERNESLRRADEAHPPCIVLIVYHNVAAVVKKNSAPANASAEKITNQKDRVILRRRKVDK